MKNFDENELIDKAMAGRLNVEEQRLWATLLAERPELEAEIEIGRAMRAMPKPQVSSNFTALVMQEVNRAEPERTTKSSVGWLRWPRLFRFPFWVGASVLVIGLSVTFNHHRKQELVTKSVESLAGGLSVVSMVEPDMRPQTAVVLAQDFETIRKLPTSASVDYELLAAFNE